MVYAPHLLKTAQIEKYSYEQFLKDLINECEKDIRLCLGNLISYLFSNYKIF